MPKDSRTESLCQALSHLRSAASVRLFLEDLCTPTEIEAMADRWQTVLLLETGLTYRQINELTGVSTATITRVARCLNQGPGGYRQALKKKPKEQRK